MGSVFERFGEHLGYGLAAVILGPHAALERRARRAMRTALLDFCRERGPMKLEAPRGSVRRSAQLPAPGGSLSVELQVDLDERTAWASIALERLPSYVNARITRSASSLGAEAREEGKARAIAGPFRLETASLDDDAAGALVQAVASGPLAGIEALELTLSSDHLELLVLAPATSERWATIGEGVVSLVTWLVARWPPSYR